MVGVRAGSAATVALLGEAKLQPGRAGVAVLARLERARELLSRRFAVDAGVKLAVFSASGFDRGLQAASRRRSDVELVDLERLYTGE